MTLTIPGPILQPVRWMPDGRALTYVAVQGKTAPNSGVANLWAQPLAGGPPKQITDFKTDRIFGFDWTRDGQLLVSRGVESKDVVLIKDVR